MRLRAEAGPRRELSSPADLGAAGLEMSKISIAGCSDVIRSEFEL